MTLATCAVVWKPAACEDDIDASAPSSLPSISHHQQGVETCGVGVRQKRGGDGAWPLGCCLEACLQGCYRGLSAVHPAISQGQGSVQRDLGHIRQQSSGHPLIDVCERGKLTAVVKSVALGRSKSAVAIF